MPSLHDGILPGAFVGPGHTHQGLRLFFPRDSTPGTNFITVSQQDSSYFSSLLPRTSPWRLLGVYPAASSFDISDLSNDRSRLSQPLVYFSASYPPPAPDTSRIRLSSSTRLRVLTQTHCTCSGFPSNSRIPPQFFPFVSLYPQPTCAGGHWATSSLPLLRQVPLCRRLPGLRRRRFCIRRRRPRPSIYAQRSFSLQPTTASPIHSLDFFTVTGRR